MTDKILYGLGCTCDPHMICQQNFKCMTAPSLFAGCVQLQEEQEEFIPMKLFNGEFEKYFFGMENWKRIYDIQNSGIDGLKMGENGDMFIYLNNMQKRIRTDVKLKQEWKVNEDRLVLINEKLGIINFHANDKTPGTNPLYEDYQRKKYEFFLRNRFNLKYLIYLHKSTKIEQLLKFKWFLSENGFDIKNFTIFSRNQYTEGIGFRTVYIKDSNSQQSNTFYTQQVDEIKREIVNIISNSHQKTT